MINQITRLQVAFKGDDNYCEHMTIAVLRLYDEFAKYFVMQVRRVIFAVMSICLSVCLSVVVVRHCWPHWNQWYLEHHFVHADLHMLTLLRPQFEYVGHWVKVKSHNGKSHSTWHFPFHFAEAFKVKVACQCQCCSVLFSGWVRKLLEPHCCLCFADGAHCQGKRDCDAHDSSGM